MKFSVAICVYRGDNPQYFDEALKSIVENSIIPDEIILVVDGPIPKQHEEVIEKYKKYLTVFRFEENQGHGNARRKSLELCQNELIAIMDADDVCCSNRFEQQLKEFSEHPEMSIVGGQIEEFIGDSNHIVGKREVPQNHEDIVSFLKKRCPFNQMTVMFKKSDVIKAGNYLDWFCNEDYYLWIRMYLNDMKFANLNQTLVFVRVNDELYMRRGGYKYFKSEYDLQKYMYQNKIISFPRLSINVIERLIIQVLMPNRLRGFIFKKLIRSKV